MSDQELFAKGLATYQKVVSLNYMAHKEVYGLLRQVLVTEAPDQFVFLDVACGTATASANALKGSKVHVDLKANVELGKASVGFKSKRSEVAARSVGLR